MQDLFASGVAIVAPFPPPYGGMSLQADKLHHRLAAEGVGVVVIATNPRPPRFLGFVQLVPGLRTVLREVQYLTLLSRGLRRSDVIHHLSASGLYFFLHSAPLLILARICRRKVILNYRGGNAAKFLGSWAALVIPLMRLADGVAVPSEYLRGVFERYDIESFLLPNIADIELFPYKERHQFAPRLLVTRNLEPMYNVECVLRTFRAVQSKCPQAILSIVGTGSEDASLRQRVREWQLSGVTFYGAVPNDKLPAIYAEHDIYVNASSVDNFPGALVEAACSGLAIVTTGAGGIPNMIHNRDNGLLVDVNDHEALAGGVLECLQNQDLARGLTRAARSWAEQFSWANVLPKLMDCYGLSVVVDRTKPLAKESDICV